MGTTWSRCRSAGARGGRVGKIKFTFIFAAAILLFAAPQAARSQQKSLKGAATPAHFDVAQPSGGAPATRNSRDDAAELQHRGERYRLCPSDVISLTFPITPEFDQTVSIEPDGYVNLTGAGDVHLAGLTTAESAAAVKAAYASVLHEPIVTVALKEFNKPYFIVNGQVKSPGKFDLRGATTATEAIAMAGGFNDAAKHSQVLLFRRVNNDWFAVEQLDLKNILRGHNVHEDPEIHSGDMLYVPQNAISKIEKFIPRTGMGAYYQAY